MKTKRETGAGSEYFMVRSMIEVPCLCQTEGAKHGAGPLWYFHELYFRSKQAID